MRLLREAPIPSVWEVVGVPWQQAPPHMTQRPSSVVVVPNGSSLGYLRKDVVSDLVFEVWIMVSQGLPHHHPQEGGVGARARGPKIKISTKSPLSTHVASEPLGMI